MGNLLTHWCQNPSCSVVDLQSASWGAGPDGGRADMQQEQAAAVCHQFEQLQEYEPWTKVLDSLVA